VSHRSYPVSGRLALRLLAGVLSAALLAVPWTGAVGSDTDSSDLPGRADGLPPGVESELAQAALEHVEEVIADRVARPRIQPVPRRDLTLALRDLQVAYDDLAPPAKARARELLARPTEGEQDLYGYTKPAEAAHHCAVGSRICVHWAPTDPMHAPDPTDLDGNAVPDFVDLVRTEFDHVWQRVVVQGGYRAPLPDSPADGDGPDTRLDIYLADIGSDQLYGYCVPEREHAGLTASGYCVVDNDYSPGQFGPTQKPADNLRVTAAHEFFHAVQFAYDYAEDHWLMEGTAAWVEDEVYDQINDNRQFIVGGPMTDPRRPLDAAGHGNAQHYTAWTWWRFLAERHPEAGASGMPLIVRRIWRLSEARDPRRDRHSLRATVAALAERGARFTDTVAAYGEAKRRPAAVFSEGRAYPRVRTLGHWVLPAGARSRPKVARLPHLTSQTYTFFPGAGTGDPRWRLRIPVDAPDTGRGSHAQVSVLRQDGRRVVRPVRLDARGVGSIITDFSSTQVRRVELTLTNAGRRYSCWEGTQLACQGRSLDNGLRTSFRGVTFRS
jgi:hypothetical protein